MTESESMKWTTKYPADLKWVSNENWNEKSHNPKEENNNKNSYLIRTTRTNKNGEYITRIY